MCGQETLSRRKYPRLVVRNGSVKHPLAWASLQRAPWSRKYRKKFHAYKRAVVLITGELVRYPPGYLHFLSKFWWWKVGPLRFKLINKRPNTQLHRVWSLLVTYSTELKGSRRLSISYDNLLVPQKIECDHDAHRHLYRSQCSKVWILLYNIELTVWLGRLSIHVILVRREQYSSS